MAKQELTVEQFEAETAGGKIFTVEFHKRTTGELRKMNCRRGVSKGVKGTGMKYNPRERDLLTVYDMQKINEGTDEKGAFRMVNLSDLVSLKLGGKTYGWNAGKRVFIEA
jgi:hypothetical protein